MAQRLSFGQSRLGRRTCGVRTGSFRFSSCRRSTVAFEMRSNKRPTIWAFFVPYTEDRARPADQEELLKDQVPRIFVETIVGEYTSLNDDEEGNK